jgi:hypothetical protein
MVWVRKGDSEFRKGFWYYTTNEANTSIDWNDGSNWKGYADHGVVREMEAGATYYWKVWACDATNCGFSSDSSFTIASQ